MIYALTPEQHAQIVDALSCKINLPKNSVSQIALDQASEMLKGLKPLEPFAYGWVGSDGHIRDCISPETHEVVEGSYTLPLYALEAK